MQYKIESLNEPKQCWIPQEITYIGKDESCSLRITDARAEPRHVRIENTGLRLTIRDLRSQIGTYVNDARILEAVLKDGDLIRIGECEFMVHDLSVKKTEFQVNSRCESWNERLQTLASVANTPYPVLLLGPSGTGKDVLAHALHESSSRRTSAFLSVNCSALTETLVESELFGHIKGSFTGAISDRKGAFESARGGTLFLDEIGDLSYGLQAKLLRAIENSEIRPVGSDRNIRTDVRIIAATHQNLYSKIQEGTFRSDLFYRLNVVIVDIPSLKERIEDFEDLLYQFARQMRVRFSHNAIQMLKKHEWPGNIRELKNVVARASALYPKQYIEEKHIDVILNRFDRNLPQHTAGTLSGTAGNPGQSSVIKEIERQMIIKRLTANQGNQKRTASDLGMPKSTLHDRIRSYNLKLDEFRV